MLKYTTFGTQTQPRVLILALHGMGTNGTDLKPIANALGLSGVLFVFPDAPFVMGPDTYQWYDFREGSQEIPESALQLHTLIAHLRKQHPCPIILAGFSQGAVMTLEAGLTLDPPPLALVALSGYLWRLPTLTAPLPPVFAAHGTFDPVIPIQAGQRLNEQLTAAGVSVTYQEFEMGHGISPEVLVALRDFLGPLI